MKNRKLSLLELLVNFFNDVFHKKNLIIMIGKNGFMFSAFSKHELIDNAFYNHPIQNQIDDCTSFLKKYQKYRITLLLDSEHCTINHETLHILNSILKVHPVEEYIEKHFDSSDIVAFNVHNVSTENGEIWKTTIAKMPYVYPIKTLLEIFIRNSIKFSGIYFLSLEFQPIIDGLITKSNNHGSSNHLQVFATITKSSGIKVAVKHKGKIIDEITALYPIDKSDLYVQGTIEQIINEELLKVKDYINGLNLPVSIFLLCDKSLRKLFCTMKVGSHKIIPLSASELSRINNLSDERFQDNVLAELFIQNKNYRAFNSKLKSIAKLTLIDSLFFKLLAALIIILIITLISLRYETIQVQKETLNFNIKYYFLSEEYRKIKKKHPDIINVSNLADLYSYDKLLKATSPTPYDHLKDILALKHPQIDIKRIKWELPDGYPSINQAVKINIDLKFNTQLDDKDGIDILEIYTNQIRSIFQDYNVSFIIAQKKIVQLPKKLVVPARIIISSKILGQEDVR